MEITKEILLQTNMQNRISRMMKSAVILVRERETQVVEVYSTLYHSMWKVKICDLYNSNG